MIKSKSCTILQFDPSDRNSLLDLMSRHIEYPNMLLGENSEGEDVAISILKDSIVLVTYQRNHWVRKNIYYKDIDEVEETYPTRW